MSALAKSLPARFLNHTGYTLVMMLNALGHITDLPKRARALLGQMFVIGVESLPIACFFLMLVGMVFALQTGIELARFNQTSLVGIIIAAGMVRELGPWMTAFVLVARVGGSMAAEIGTMQVSEEIDALDVMSINPVSFVVMPRLLGYAIMGPILTVIATCVGIAGGAIVAKVQLGVQLSDFLRNAKNGVEPLDIYWGALKAFVFSLTAATVACSYGMRTKGGAVGVGAASRNTVVTSLTLIVFFNYLLTSFYRIVKMLITGA